MQEEECNKKTIRDTGGSRRKQATREKWKVSSNSSTECKDNISSNTIEEQYKSEDELTRNLLIGGAILNNWEHK
ncbi:hypothetical protein KY285_026305 [Solanum tuberosum]|nr:hypothetical protein KY285_026305 [Solanum tuberosum]